MELILVLDEFTSARCTSVVDPLLLRPSAEISGFSPKPKPLEFVNCTRNMREDPVSEARASVIEVNVCDPTLCTRVGNCTFLPCVMILKLTRLPVCTVEGGEHAETNPSETKKILNHREGQKYRAAQRRFCFSKLPRLYSFQGESHLWRC